MRILISFLTIFFTLFIFNCNKEIEFNPSDVNQLLEIYIATEKGGDLKETVYSKYKLKNQDNYVKYKRALQELETDKDKWEEFIATASSEL